MIVSLKINSEVSCFSFHYIVLKKKEEVSSKVMAWMDGLQQMLSLWCKVLSPSQKPFTSALRSNNGGSFLEVAFSGG